MLTRPNNPRIGKSFPWELKTSGGVSGIELELNWTGNKHDVSGDYTEQAKFAGITSAFKTQSTRQVLSI